MASFRAMRFAYLLNGRRRVPRSGAGGSNLRDRLGRVLPARLADLRRTNLLDRLWCVLPAEPSGNASARSRFAILKPLHPLRVRPPLLRRPRGTSGQGGNAHPRDGLRAAPPTAPNGAQQRSRLRGDLIGVVTARCQIESSGRHAPKRLDPMHLSLEGQNRTGTRFDQAPHERVASVLCDGPRQSGTAAISAQVRFDARHDVRAHADIPPTAAEMDDAVHAANAFAAH